MTYTHEEWVGLVDRLAKVVKERDAARAALTTGRRQRQRACGDSEPVEEAASEGGEVVVSAESYQELLEKYDRLARERLLVNVLCVASGMVAFILLAVQVYRVLGRGYW